MGARTVMTLLLVASLLGTLSCRREMRAYRPDTPDAQLVQWTRLVDLQAGNTESPAPTGELVLPLAGVENLYEENAYALSEGKRLFSYFNCTGCHAHGGGGSGPPLMDEEWIYGKRPEQVFATIVEGRPNGMPSFGGRIPAYQIWQLAAYVRSMSGLVPITAAPNRDDDMRGPPPENSRDSDRQPPQDASAEDSP